LIGRDFDKKCRGGFAAFSFGRLHQNVIPGLAGDDGDMQTARLASAKQAVHTALLQQ